MNHDPGDRLKRQDRLITDTPNDNSTGHWERLECAAPTMTLLQGFKVADLRLGWESGGSPQNLQETPTTPNQRNRKSPSQLDFANIANVPGSPLTGRSTVSG